MTRLHPTKKEKVNSASSRLGRRVPCKHAYSDFRKGDSRTRLWAPKMLFMQIRRQHTNAGNGAEGDTRREGSRQRIKLRIAL